MPEKSVFMLKAIAEKVKGGFSEPSRTSLVTYYLEKFWKKKKKLFSFGASYSGLNKLL